MSVGMARTVRDTLLFLVIHWLVMTTGQEPDCPSSPVKLTASTQVQAISSPGYPNGYPYNLNCGWQITADNGHVKVTVEDINVEESHACVYDALEMYDVIGPDAFLCGILDSKPVYYSSGHSLEVWFRSDETESRKGFNLTYQWVKTSPSVKARPCSQEELQKLQATTKPQQLTSFNYPQKYPNRMDCYWQVTANSDNAVLEIVVEDHYLQASRGCRKDWLRIYDGSIEEGGLIIDVCGRLGRKKEIQSRSGVFEIHFHSDELVSGRGFRLSYREMDNNSVTDQNAYACPKGIVHLKATDKPQNLTSYNYPGYYPKNLKCYWTLQSLDRSKKVEINLLDYGIEGSPTCKYDQLRLGDSVICGEFDPKISYVSRFMGMMFISFLTDLNSAGRGFMLTYKQVTDETTNPTAADVCPNTIQQLNATSDPQELRPFTVGGGYLNFLDCRWKITSSYGFVKIFVNETSIVRTTSDCRHDFLEIYDGPQSEENRIARYCGPGWPNTFWTTSTEATVYFHTNVFERQKGFQIFFSQVDERFT